MGYTALSPLGLGLQGWYTLTTSLSSMSVLAHFVLSLLSDTGIILCVCVCVMLLTLVTHVPFGVIMYNVNVSGISESAGVALAMFIVHVATLTVVCVTSAFYAFFNVNTLQDNLKQV